MTTAELIEKGLELEPTIAENLAYGEDGILAALEAFWGHGSSDDQAGEADGPFGHVYRVDRWIVQTNNQGDHEVVEFETEQAAIDRFEKVQEDA